MINDFWNLIVETWQTGIRGVGIDDILICLAIIIVSLVARNLFNTYLLDKIAKLAENSEELIQTIVRMKPSASKGIYIRSISISSTMGIGVSVSTNAY